MEALDLVLGEKEGGAQGRRRPPKGESGRIWPAAEGRAATLWAALRAAGKPARPFWQPHPERCPFVAERTR